HLSVSLPERTPQKSAARISLSVVRLMTNSPLSFIIWYECRPGRTEIYVMGGFVHTVPVHAIVIILSFPSGSAVLTITAGRGYSIFPGFQICFDIFCLLRLLLLQR